MTTKQTAANLRASLKSAGYNARMVSVRTSYYSMGSSITLTIRSADVDYATVKALADGAEKIDRCEFSGEILSGGNTYVHLNFDSKVEDEVAARVKDATEAALALAKASPGSCIDIDGVPGLSLEIDRQNPETCGRLWAGCSFNRQFWPRDNGPVDAVARYVMTAA